MEHEIQEMIKNLTQLEDEAKEELEVFSLINIYDL